MKYAIIGLMLLTGCYYHEPWERELSRWYRRQVMWEKYQQVQQSKKETPGKPVEAVRSEYLELLTRAADQSKRTIEADDGPYWSYEHQRLMPRRPAPRILVDRQAESRPTDGSRHYGEVSRAKLAVGDHYLYHPPGEAPYRVRIAYAQYYSTYGIANIIKWNRIHIDGTRGQLESSKDGWFSTLEGSL